MSDIIDRLRATAQGIDLGAEGMGWSPDPALLRETSDEIARLRAELAAVRADAERWHHARQGFSAMSLNIDGMHSWTWRGYSLLGKGATIEEAIDAARGGQQ